MHPGKLELKTKTKNHCDGKHHKMAQHCGIIGKVQGP